MNPPFEHYFDLSALSSAGQDVRVVAKRDDLERIAQWADVQSIGRFEALISLRKLSQSRFSYGAILKVDAVQSCVVSSMPVSGAHRKDFLDRELHLVSHVPRGLAPHGEYPVSQTEEEPPEDIESARYDLAAPLLEGVVPSTRSLPAGARGGFPITDCRRTRAGESPLQCLRP